MSKYYYFETANVVCDQFNKFVNTLRKEKEQSKEKYPWLDKNDERECMVDEGILDKYINLDNFCLIDRENTAVRDLLYKCKDTFSLRDEIGTCPNIEVEIDVTDKIPFFIRPYHAKEEDKNT